MLGGDEVDECAAGTLRLNVRRDAAPANVRPHKVGGTASRRARVLDGDEVDECTAGRSG